MMGRCIVPVARTTGCPACLGEAADRLDVEGPLAALVQGGAPRLQELRPSMASVPLAETAIELLPTGLGALPNSSGGFILQFTCGLQTHKGLHGPRLHRAS